MGINGDIQILSMLAECPSILTDEFEESELPIWCRSFANG